MDVQQNGTLKSLALMSAIAVRIAVAVAIAVCTFAGYRWFTASRPSPDDDGNVRAKVIRAVLYAKDELRVAQLSGVVQGVATDSRAWGWLTSSQVIKAPFTVDYYVKLNPSEIRMNKDGKHFLIDAPDVYTDKPNIDTAKTTLNDVSGFFVTRSAYSDLASKVTASSQEVSTAKAHTSDEMARAREFARNDLKRLFEGALRAAKVDAEVEVRFPADPRPQDDRRWDVSRSIEQVLADPSLR